MVLGLGMGNWVAACQYRRRAGSAMSSVSVVSFISALAPGLSGRAVPNPSPLLMICLKSGSALITRGTCITQVRIVDWMYRERNRADGMIWSPHGISSASADFTGCSAWTAELVVRCRVVCQRSADKVMFGVWEASVLCCGFLMGA